ncbi:hypothetical protein BC831DRAFT_478296 [Entophlyctis helioformis]|nr:hypothetical protein BC831DRAFT_494229 [Entophlyctis helioformis]KAI8920595.1 hypothetical protein BC831DRAFT_478296 [Entophlyctis helioformis]
MVRGRWWWWCSGWWCCLRLCLRLCVCLCCADGRCPCPARLELGPVCGVRTARVACRLCRARSGPAGDGVCLCVAVPHVGASACSTLDWLDRLD